MKRGPTCRQAGFVPIIFLPIILLGLAFVYGIYWYTGSIINSPESPTIQTPTPSQDPTANWDTYTNNDFDFIFNYPADWEVKDITNEEIWYPEKIGKPYPYGDGSYISLKDFYKYRYNDNVLSIITLLPPQDIKPVVPKKGPGSAWISGVRLEIRNADKDYISSYREEIKNIEFKEEKINDWIIFKYNQPYFGNESTSVFAALSKTEDKYFKLTNDGLGTRSGSEIIDRLIESFRFLTFL